MKKAIIAKKVGMTQVFSPEGTVVPVTVLQAGPCSVVQIKTQEKDGYSAVQLAYGAVKDKLVTKALKGHYEKANVLPRKRIKEFRLEDIADYEAGKEITCAIFEEGDKVDISGKSKGKGFQGNIKRHGQHRGPMKHGSKYHRAVGSMGASTSPSRVFKAKKLPGHMGDVKCTVQNLTVVKSDAEKNMLLVKGAVPGSNGSVVYVVDTVKK
jgi:large subunit ribosomal protein L3